MEETQHLTTEDTCCKETRWLRAGNCRPFHLRSWLFSRPPLPLPPYILPSPSPPASPKSSPSPWQTITKSPLLPLLQENCCYYYYYWYYRTYRQTWVWRGQCRREGRTSEWRGRKRSRCFVRPHALLADRRKKRKAQSQTLNSYQRMSDESGLSRDTQVRSK